VLKWPDREAVERSAREWAEREAPRHPGLLRLGYFGSYARGDAGVGSDLDLVAVVESSPDPFERRALAWDLLTLPVPAEILVYTREEWERLHQQGGRFARALQQEARWLRP
jgi:predicted nucleotidyltransferase